MALRVRGFAARCFLQLSCHAAEPGQTPRVPRRRARTTGKSTIVGRRPAPHAPGWCGRGRGPWAILRAHVRTHSDRGGRAGRRAGRRYTTPQGLRGKADGRGRLALAPLPAAAAVEEVPGRRARA